MRDNLFLIDINNKEHIKLIKAYEKKNNLNNILSYLKNNDLNHIIIKEIICSIGKEGIKDICFIRAEKDKKTFFIDFIEKNKDIRNKPLIRYAEEYAFKNLGMEEIFIQVKKDNKRLINNIEDENFDKLWEEHDIITFIKNKELEKEQGRVVHGTR